jgi:DNA-binding CsgD family transcriptional regulator/tetratricopeptide (TPR) repeat protein
MGPQPLSALAVLPPLGRERELAAVAAALAAPGPRAVVLAGPAGIGKSTVWRAALAAAADAGWRVLSVRPRQVEAAMSFAGLQDLFGECVDEITGALPAPQRVALDAALLRAAPGDEPVEARAVAAAVLTMMRTLGERRRVLVAVDDAQWLDHASAEALAYATRRLIGEAVRLLVTWRTEAGPLELGLDADELLRLDLEPLTQAALQDIVRVQLGHRVGMSAARALHRLSGGNPFYALELARSRPDGDFAFDRPLALQDVRALLGRRFAELPLRAVRSLAAISAMNEPTVARLRTIIADESDLDAAFALGIVTEPEPGLVEFTHPLLAAAAYAAISPPQRRAIHTELARSATSVEERARHLALSIMAPDAAAAAEVEAGAVAAAARGAVADAARLFELAARLTPPADRQAVVSRRLAAAHWHSAAGDQDRAVAIWTVLARMCEPGEIRAEALIQLAHSSVVDYRHSLDMGRKAVAESTTVRSRIRRTALHAMLVGLSDTQAALAMGRAAAAEARTAGDDVALCAVLPGLGLQLALSTPELDGLPLLREAVALQRRLNVEVSAYQSAAGGLGTVLVQRNELREARAVLRVRLEECLARGDEGAGCGVAMHLCEAYLRGGDLDCAEDLIDWVLKVTDTGQPSQDMCLDLAFAALVATHRGDVDRARDFVRRIRDMLEAVGEPHSELAYRAAAGILEFHLGNPAAAIEHLEPTVDIWRRVGYVEPGAYFFLPDRLEALIAVGRHADAARDIDEWEAIGRRYDRPYPLATGARARGLLLTAQGRLADAENAFRQALDQHQRLDWPHQHGRTLLAHGATLRRTGRRRDARAQLDGALEVFERIGEPLWAARARTELARLGGRRPSGHTLTDAEQRVVELVAAGRTNREVAAELVVTVRTVEAVLTRAYAKLGLRSRTELAAKWPTTAS